MKARTWIEVAIGLLVVLSLFIPLYQATSSRRFLEDEHIFVRRGVFADYYFSGQFFDPIWQSFDSYDVPKLAELFYGVVLRVYSGKTVASYFNTIPHFLNPTTTPEFLWPIMYAEPLYTTIQDLPTHIQERVVPVLLVRKVAVFFALFSLGILWFICWRVKNWWFGIVTVVLIGQNILFKESMVTAMGDSPLIFFSVLYALFACLFFTAYQKSDFRQTLIYFLLAAVTTGLATATKLNGVINLIHFAVCAQLFLGWGKTPFRVLKYQLSFVALAYFVYFLLNPFLWTNPFRNSLFMSVSRQVTIERQQERSAIYGQSLTSLPQRVVTVYQRTLASEGFYSNFTTPVGSLLFALGCYFATKTVTTSKVQTFGERVKRFLRQLFGLTEPTVNLELKVFLLWVGAWIGVTTALIPLDWDHYYLPIVIGVSCLQSYALVEMIERLLARFPTLLNIIPKQQ